MRDNSYLPRNLIYIAIASAIVIFSEATTREIKIEEERTGTGTDFTVIDSGVLVESNKPGCAGVKCLEPYDDQKSGCKSSTQKGAKGLKTCCVIWSCANKNGKVYNNGTVSGVVADYPPATQKLPANIPPTPPGVNVTYQSQEKSFNQEKPGFKEAGRTSVYSYNTKSSVSSTSEG